ncbi:hypothetical protein AMTRI_Chr09g13430 [Amborella trichopoda]
MSLRTSMADQRRFLCSLLLVTLLLVASEMGTVAEARVCQAQRGHCLSDTNCAYLCKKEGFFSGLCKGLRRRCFCSKPC